MGWRSERKPEGSRYVGSHRLVRSACPYRLRTVKVALVAFVVLQLKEWFDAGALDLTAGATDAALIAAGALVLDALLYWVRA
ncbi:MAG: hypothetical protein KatS3mg050_4060 [Litorilinea sp.]|nr:MAG: hypothetical protein KatS3mg050_4055 [Litorilinea sp.]GIV79666.1 MAG: hypothetical protein KatS3mg050_4060 [Litorilinea sp.]